MWLEKKLRREGLAFAMLSMFILLLVYLSVDHWLQQKAQAEIRYATALTQLADRVSLDLSLPETAEVLKQLDAFRSGKGLMIAGEPMNTNSFAEFLAPAPSSLDDLIWHIKAANSDLAIIAAKDVVASVKKRINPTIKLSKNSHISFAVILVAFYFLVLLPKLLRLSGEPNSESGTQSNPNAQSTSFQPSLAVSDSVAQDVEDAMSEIDPASDPNSRVDLLMRVLAIDPNQLRAFLLATGKDLKDIKSIIESDGADDQAVRGLVKRVNPAILSLKNRSDSLAFVKFSSILRGLDISLAKIKLSSASLTSEALLPVKTIFKELLNEFDYMQNIVKRLDQIRADIALGNDAMIPLNSRSKTTSMVTLLQGLVDRVCDQSNKHASLSAFGLTLDKLPLDLQKPVKRIVEQLVRNSIVHGAMSPSDRLNAGKTDYINITISLNETDDDFTLFVRDDGEGFDSSAILERAVSKGIISHSEVDKIDRKQTFKLIFHPLFNESVGESGSKHEKTTGLDVVHSITKELGGAIGVNHLRGRYCQFKIRIPKAHSLSSQFSELPSHYEL